MGQRGPSDRRGVRARRKRSGARWRRACTWMCPSVRGQFEKLQQLHQLVALSHGTRHHADFVPNESAFTELAKHVKGKPAEEAASVRAAYFPRHTDGRELPRTSAPPAVRRQPACQV